MEVLELEFLGNSLKAWLMAAGIFFLIQTLTLGARAWGKKIASRLFEQTGKLIFSFSTGLVSETRWYFLMAFSLFLASTVLKTPEKISHVLFRGMSLMFLIQMAIWGNYAINYWAENTFLRKKEKDAAEATAIGIFKILALLAMWIIIVLLALANFGFDVTTLVAGLGVGGIAIALAVQKILSDLFASLTIVLDKPFVIGDFIIAGDSMGTVERIGLKTTRIRSLSGEQLIMPNSSLLESRIRNFKRMERRRAVFTLGVIYQTPLEKLQQIPAMLESIIKSQDSVEFDRAHFKEYGAFSLNFEVVYWVLNSDYKMYMDIQQRINHLIYERFHKEGIEFAYPTQTLYVEKTST